MKNTILLLKSKLYPLILAAITLAGVAIGCGGKHEKSAVAEGEEWFRSYCANCHGEKGDGKGNMASMLDTPPLDLTKIAQRRGGNFPEAEIASIIANIENVPGHSTGNMPVWSEAFKKAENITNEQVLQEKINHIVAYLKTIQQ